MLNILNSLLLQLIGFGGLGAQSSFWHSAASPVNAASLTHPCTPRQARTRNSLALLQQLPQCCVAVHHVQAKNKTEPYRQSSAANGLKPPAKAASSHQTTWTVLVAQSLPLMWQRSTP